MVKAVIGFGSNLGDRSENIRRAAERLGVSRLSSLIETEPMYVEDQPPFINAVGFLETNLGPLALLRLLKALESEIGRLPRERYGPREIDLDLIAYGRLQLRSLVNGSTKLQVPHPRLAERSFVLDPLAELDPFLQIPGLGIGANLRGMNLEC
jgi:2-amino-4-hydroxy-6-hydroxymethyldihydropteridine diphosphokinase